MIDSVLNLVFRCGHRRVTRPITPVDRSPDEPNETYVVCLDCGKRFAYDLSQMRIRKSADNGGFRFRYLLWALAVPAGWILGKSLRPRSDHGGAPRQIPQSGKPSADTHRRL